MTGKRKADQVVTRVGTALEELERAGYVVAAGTTCCCTCFHAERPRGSGRWAFYPDQEEERLRSRRGEPGLMLYVEGDTDELLAAFTAAGMLPELVQEGLLWAGLPDAPPVD